MFTTGARPDNPIVDHAACSNERERFKRAYIEGYPARIQTPIGQAQEPGLYRDVRNRAVSLGSGGCQVRESGVVKDLGLPGSG